MAGWQCKKSMCSYVWQSSQQIVKTRLRVWGGFSNSVSEIVLQQASVKEEHFLFCMALIKLWVFLVQHRTSTYKSTG